MSTRYLGKYEIRERLGRGGMAEVYKGYHAALDRYVAIKLLHSFLADDSEFKVRFEREAQNVAKLRHPNIVQVYDFDYDPESESYYMVMEFVDGITLRERLVEQGNGGDKLEVADILRIGREITQALVYAHSLNMAHRDVKPANIMIDKRSQVYLTDFGIAKILTGAGQFTATGEMIGTPAYMAPEQGLGGAGDERSDIYSLGVILFHMATNDLPFEAETPLGTILKHVNEEIPPIRQINPDIPGELERIIRKAMAKEPEDRYQTAQDLLNDLNELALKTPGAISDPTAITTTQNLKPIQSALASMQQEQKQEEEAQPVKSGRNWLPIGIGVAVVAVVAVIALLVLGGGGAATETATPTEQVSAGSTATITVEETPTSTPTLTPTLIGGSPGNIVYAGGGGNESNLFLLNRTEGSTQQLTSEFGINREPAFSPDGEWIAFISDRNGTFDLFVRSRERGAATRITEDAAIEAAPAWSPDGTRIAFSKDGDLYLINQDGTDLKRITDTPEGEAEPSWSPDGTQITYISSDPEAGTLNLCVMQADGANSQCIVPQKNENDWNRTPSWSPDGTKLAFVSGRAGYANIYIITIADGRVTPLIDDGIEREAPVWSPDSQAIAYVVTQENSSSLWIAGLDCEDDCEPVQLIEERDGFFIHSASFALSEEDRVVPTPTPPSTDTPTFTPSDTPTLTPTLTLTPTETIRPSDTPTPTATPSPNFTETIAACMYDYAIMSRSPEDGSSITAGSTFALTITFENAGNCSWEPNTEIVYIAGERMGFEQRIIIPQMVEVGERIDVTLDLALPEAAGEVTGSFALVTASRSLIGEPFEVNVFAFEEEE